MATVVSVMDRDGWDANTDIIVVVDPSRRRLVWVPRDVWCDAISDRINRAFALGGHLALMNALVQLGLRVDQSLCLQRCATDQALDGVEVLVRVRKHFRFWYPLTPTTPIEDGRKPIDFLPPSEILRGERIHQWIGARYERDGGPSTDFDRIRRQQVLLRALLKMGFVFSRTVQDRSLVSMSSELALADLGKVRRWWRLRRYRHLENKTIDGMSVLVVRSRRLHFGALGTHRLLC